MAHPKGGWELEGNWKVRDPGSKVKIVRPLERTQIGWCWMGAAVGVQFCRILKQRKDGWAS